jgi:hypothetical protein
VDRDASRFEREGGPATPAGFHHQCPPQGL